VTDSDPATLMVSAALQEKVGMAEGGKGRRGRGRVMQCTAGINGSKRTSHVPLVNGWMSRILRKTYLVPHFLSREVTVFVHS
jgi:hypothetical protein